MLASRERRETSIALTSTLHWFETEVLAEERNYQGLARLNTDLVQHEAARPLAQRLILDIDSSESPVHGAQEQSAYNGHFESVCYHPLFVFNQDGDCLAATLRPGNVHSADGWEKILLPIIERAQGQAIVVRADAAFAIPALYEALERRGVAYAIRLPANDVLERAIPELPVPGRLLGPASAGHRQGRTSPRGTLSTGGLHRHDLDRNEPGRRPLLQPAWDSGAMDQGGQRSYPLDAPLVPPLPGQ